MQQLVNTEISLNCFQSHGIYFPPIVVSLAKEAILGWDSAFHLPWINLPANPNHKGCNLFIQYKLASLLETESAGEFSFWEMAYYRFQIPHESKDPITGAFILDYHQFASLKSLADINYPVYYVTNSVVFEKDLLQLARSLKLGDSCSWFSVADISANHRYVSFSNRSDHGLLHSEPEKIAKKSFESIVESINSEGQEKTDFSSDFKYLRTIIDEFEKRTEVSTEFRLDNSLEKINNRIPDEFRPQFKARLIASRLNYYFGLQWFKF
ncbi:hypothetical protein [Leptospira interrogans]|uniref:hypothetical protein n=1 Tax=Leptospira interrogans TaxID=173 RepID=UPI0012B5797C|nr:hypothetical protein [Leptospira interrogans]